jgi:tRNA U34 5-methylaminomethyl-2-thiouridine-forming methyltransferase MnmC
VLRKEDIEYISTGDGSQTLYNKKLKVSYKSEHGAQQESLHVFVEGCQLKKIPKTWRVLELGLGTGRNFLNTFVQAELLGVSLHYEALEWEPIPNDMVAEVANATVGRQAVQRLLRDVRQSKQREELTFGERGHCLIIHPFSYQSTLLPRHFFHALYHDPFTPNINEESWSTDYFRWAYSVLQKDGVLSTYSSAGQVRRNLAEAGFYVGVTEGPGRKREITLASAREDCVSHCHIKNRPM